VYDVNLIKSILKIGLNDIKCFVELSALPIEVFQEYVPLVTWAKRHYNQFGTLLTIDFLGTVSQKSEFLTHLFHQFRAINTKPATTADFAALLAMVKKEWSRERLVDEVKGAIKALEAKANPLLITERLTSNLQATLSTTQETFKRHQIKHDALTSVEDYQREQKEPRNLIPFGYKSLDQTAGGMKKGDLVLIIGPTGGGKSTLLVNFACNVFKAGYKVLFVSLEIPLRRMRARCHANLLGMDYGKLIQYTTEVPVYQHEVQKLFDDTYGEITVIDLPVATTATQLSNMIIKEAPDVLIVDYIGLMRSIRGNRSADWEEQMDIANELKMLARRHEIVVMTAAQFNRAGNERSGDDLRLGDISRSFGITNPAAFVFGIRKNGLYMNLSILKANDSDLTTMVLHANFNKMKLTEDTSRGYDSPDVAAFGGGVQLG
jgi:replicative DNA helicase